MLLERHELGQPTPTPPPPPPSPSLLLGSLRSGGSKEEAAATDTRQRFSAATGTDTKLHGTTAAAAPAYTTGRAGAALFIPLHRTGRYRSYRFYDTVTCLQGQRSTVLFLLLVPAPPSLTASLPSPPGRSPQ